MAFDGTSADATVLHALGEARFGADALDTLDGGAVVTLLDGSGRATVRELRAFNNDSSAQPAELFIPFDAPSQDLVEVVSASGNLGDFVLLLQVERGGSPRFELRRPRGSAERARSQALIEIGDDPAAQLFALAEDGNWPEITAVLRAHLFRRRLLLHKIRVLASAHRDGVQNAVDTMQTKRLDFQEQPAETTVAGAVMALVIEVAIVAFPAAFAGRILVRLAAALFLLTGVARVAKQAVPAYIARNAHREKLKALSRKLERPRLSRQERQQTAQLEEERRQTRRAGEGASRKIEKAGKEIRQIMLEAREKAKPLVARLQSNPALTEPATYLVEKAAGAAGQASTSSAQLRPDKAMETGPVHVPIDVAMKMQVQDFFEEWLIACEEGNIMLDRLIEVVETDRFLPPIALPALNDILMSDAEAAGLDKDLDADTGDVGVLRAGLQTEYELLVWTLKYYDSFQKDVVRAAPHEGRAPHFVKESLPPGVDARLMRYLALRFFPSAARKDKPATGEDPDVIATYKAMRRFRDQIGSVIQGATKGADDSVVFDILREIRIIRRKL